MATKQYTIRNIPEPVDRYLRKRAKLSGQSLNQVVIDELSERAGTNKQSMSDSLDWFIGDGLIGDDVINVLAEEDSRQKEITREQWQRNDY